jgi:hypothetical protein
MSRLDVTRPVARCTALALMIGFAYSARATVVEYRRIADRRPASGPNATIDEQLRLDEHVRWSIARLIVPLAPIALLFTVQQIWTDLAADVA